MGMRLRLAEGERVPERGGGGGEGEGEGGLGARVGLREGAYL